MNTTARIEALLGNLERGEAGSRDALLEGSLDRVRVLARRTFRRQSDLRAQAETDDVVSLAMLRLHRALLDVHPPNARAFFGLAALQMRRVLTDLAREKAAERLQFVADMRSRPGTAEQPTDALEWAEFHTQVAALPDETRETFDLIYYQGLEQAEAAEVLGVSLSTFKRRWQRARLAIHEALHGECPQLEE